MKIPLNPELTQTIAIARVTERFHREIEAAQGGDLSPAFRAAFKRAKRANIDMLQRALRESTLTESAGEELARFIQALDYGEIPEGDYFMIEAAGEPEPPAETESGGIRPPGSSEAQPNGQNFASGRGGETGALARECEQTEGRAQTRATSGSVRSSGTEQTKQPNNVEVNGSAAARNQRTATPARSVGSGSKKRARSRTPLRSKSIREVGNASPARTSNPSARTTPVRPVPLVPSDAKSKEVMSQWR